MHIAGWTSWGWRELPDGTQLRRWKWHGREDLFVETNDDADLFIFAVALSERTDAP